MSDYIQYIRRELPIGAAPPAEHLTWKGPRGYGTDQSWGVLDIRSGDSIWLVSCLAYVGRRLVPSLDARVIYDPCRMDRPEMARLRRAKRHVFPAGEGSTWFPLRDASCLFKCLKVHVKAGERSLLADETSKFHKERSVGQRLAQGARSLLRLTDESGRKLQEEVLAHREAAAFVSYRCNSGDRYVVELVDRLSREMPVWWDRWSAPSRLLEADHDATETYLQAALEEAIRAAAVIVKVETEDYGRSVWTSREVDWIGSGPRVVTWKTQSESVDDALARVRSAKGASSPNC